jgi:hypothetical protein
MKTQSIMQQALGKQWQQLPLALQKHYCYEENSDIGHLTIEYPNFMQLPLNFLRLLGALVNKKGKQIPTQVEKRSDSGKQHWHRTIHITPDKPVIFTSTWVYAENNVLIEYVNPVLGLKMAMEVRDEKLYYAGKSYIVKLGKIHIPLPEWLLLGHTTFVEEAFDEDSFSMDFRLQHPLLGQIFRYDGVFRTETKRE